MAELDDKDVWGDDQLIASDVSIPYLLEKADWSGLFNGKGFSGQYPMVLFMHEEVEELNDRLMDEINRTQVLSGAQKLRVDVTTKFVGEDQDASGMALLLVSGLDEFEAKYHDDLFYLLRSGVKAWLTEAYSTHGVMPRVEWSEKDHTSLEPVWQEWVKEWYKAETSNQTFFLASITQG